LTLEKEYDIIKRQQICTMNIKLIESLKAMLEGDPELRKKFEAASDLESIVFLAQEAGFELALEDFACSQSGAAIELGDDELEAASGGNFWRALELTRSSYCFCL
jgi:predicted ribosomally synthesized peptide with nif11-like leader